MLLTAPVVTSKLSQKTGGKNVGNEPKSVLPETDIYDPRMLSVGRICIDKVRASVIVLKLRLIYKLNA